MQEKVQKKVRNEEMTDPPYFREWGECPQVIRLGHGLQNVKNEEGKVTCRSKDGKCRHNDGWN